jgi:hypothetical protein
MLAYEADVYTPDGLSHSVDLVSRDDLPTMILVGISHGKKNTKYPNESPLSLTVKNMITTMKLMEDEEK